MDYHKSLQTLRTQFQRIHLHDLEMENTNVETYRKRLLELSGKNNHAKGKKPRPLTIPEIFSRSFDENFISTYLAYILDPKKNGIGIPPLEALLNLLEIDTTGIVIDDVAIYREFFLENGRIDLFLEWQDSLILAIENKIYSPEADNQTGYYARVMNETYTDIPLYLVFLTRDGHKAQSNVFHPISYKMLFEAFKKIPKRDSWEQRKLILWEDFLEHLEVYIMNVKSNQFEFSEKARLYIDNCDMIDELTKSFDSDWQEGLSFIESRLTAYVNSDSWETNFSRRNSYQQVYKPIWRTESVSIHFEWWFDFSRFRKQKKISLMVDVEGKQADKVLALFDDQIKGIEKTYKQYDITYRPPRRKMAIAFKEYNIEQDFNQIGEVFINSFEEFRFLEPIIDGVISKLKSK
jgi:hypothetical protein